jgi:hypothetical protein
LSEEQPQVSEDLKELISTTIESIRAGVKGKDCGVSGDIDFEVSIIKSKEAKGGFKILIADASGNYSKESISKIKFKIASKNTDRARGTLTNIWLDK